MISPTIATKKIQGHDICVSNVTRLLFEWPIKKAPRLALPLFILLALLLHLSTIYFFKIVYEPLNTRKITTAQVFFLLPNSPASQKLAPWLEANDPAIFSPLQTIQKNTPQVPKTIYQLSQPTPLLHSLPDCKDDPITPLLPPTDEFILPKTFLPPQNPASRKQPLTSTLISKTTKVYLLDNLAQRTLIPISNIDHPALSPHSSIPSQPTLLTVNIDSTGIVRHVIITQSSQDDAADETATHWLMKSHFAPTGEETWGKMLIYWGNQ